MSKILLLSLIVLALLIGTFLFLSKDKYSLPTFRTSLEESEMKKPLMPQTGVSEVDRDLSVIEKDINSLDSSAFDPNF